MVTQEEADEIGKLIGDTRRSKEIESMVQSIVTPDFLEQIDCRLRHQ